jgi:hypothetical protein
MEPTIKERPNRLERINAAHPWLRENEIRLLLIFEYKRIHGDPTIRSSSDYELRLESYTDILTRMTEHDIRNCMSVVAEHLVEPWEDVIQEMSTDEEDDG